MYRNNFEPSQQIRSCTLNTPGQPPLCLFLNDHTKFSDILKIIKIVWRLNLQSLRLFDSEGRKVKEGDLKYVCKGTKLWIKNEQNVPKFPYEIIKKIGQGGQGLVYKGQHKITKELVAIKQIIIDNESIQRESLVLEALDHKNIVQFHEAIYLPQTNEQLIAMEYLTGGSLLTYANCILQSYALESLSEREAKTFSKQIIDAIAYCHTMNIVHCDLKLENVMIKSQLIKQVKIIDFGIAKYCGEIFDSDLFIGTLSYSAPELLSTAYKRIQKSQDVWAIGCIIFGLVFGRLPFDGQNQQETYNNIKQCKYGIPKKSVSKDLIDLLNIIFVRDPKERIDIIGIQNHNWFKEQVKIHKINISIDQLKFGRSSSVSKVYPIKKQTEIEDLRTKSVKKHNYRRRSVTKLDNMESTNKIQ